MVRWCAPALLFLAACFIKPDGDSIDRYKGDLDEVRVYPEALPAAWFEAEYLNTMARSSFMVIGAEELMP